MKKITTNLLVIFFSIISFSVFAQKQQKDLKYYYYYADKDPSFNAYLAAKREFDAKKVDFRLPASADAVKEIETSRNKILQSEKTYTAFLNKYGMKNSGEYASLMFNQLNALKTFIKKNPEFGALSATERQNIIDKWYYAEVGSK